MKLRMLSDDDHLAEIKRLYYQTSRGTITDDFEKALQLLKAMSSEEQRERAAVFMDGLSEMRSDWLRREKRQQAKGSGPRGDRHTKKNRPPT